MKTEVYKHFAEVGLTDIQKKIINVAIISREEVMG